MLDYFWVSARSGAHPENNTVVSQMIISSNNSLAWHVLLSLSFLRSFLIFPLPFGFSCSLSLPDRFASSPTQRVYVMLCYFFFFSSATPLLRLSLADVNHKMVDQRLFPARPLPVWVGLAADCIPGFFFIRCKIRALPFSFRLFFFVCFLSCPTPLDGWKRLVPASGPRQVTEAWMLQGEIPAVIRTRAPLLLMNLSTLLTWQPAIMW